jgi:hypothetical protein
MTTLAEAKARRLEWRDGDIEFEDVQHDADNEEES